MKKIMVIGCGEIGRIALELENKQEVIVMVMSPEQAKANGFNIPEPIPIKDLLIPAIEDTQPFKEPKSFINGKKPSKKKKK